MPAVRGNLVIGGVSGLIVLVGIVIGVGGVVVLADAGAGAEVLADGPFTPADLDAAARTR